MPDLTLLDLPPDLLRLVMIEAVENPSRDILIFQQASSKLYNALSGKSFWSAMVFRFLTEAPVDNPTHLREHIYGLNRADPRDVYYYDFEKAAAFMLNTYPCNFETNPYDFRTNLYDLYSVRGDLFMRVLPHLSLRTLRNIIFIVMEDFTDRPAVNIFDKVLPLIDIPNLVADEKFLLAFTGACCREEDELLADPPDDNPFQRDFLIKFAFITPFMDYITDDNIRHVLPFTVEQDLPYVSDYLVNRLNDLDFKRNVLLPLAESSVMKDIIQNGINNDNEQDDI